jgi:chemotaxis signal transduction protein
MSAPNGADARAQYLAFGLAGGDYAIGILRVREILQYEEVGKRFVLLLDLEKVLSAGERDVVRTVMDEEAASLLLTPPARTPDGARSRPPPAET